MLLWKSTVRQGYRQVENNFEKKLLSLCDLKVSFKSIFLLPSTERRKNNSDGDHYSFAITDI